MREIEKSKELKLGIMSNKELADWFGIKEKSFRDTKAKKLEILKEYAEFESVRGKVNILKIKDPIYIKGSQNYKFIKEKTLEQWSPTGLDTCKLVSEKIKKKYESEITVSDKTLYNYTCTSKRELWGKAFESSGEKGSCVYVWCKQIENKLIPLDQKEIKIKDKLMKKYFGTEKEKISFLINTIIDEELEAKEKEEKKEKAFEIYETMKLEDKNYFAFKNELEMILNSKIVKATKVTFNAF